MSPTTYQTAWDCRVSFEKSSASISNCVGTIDQMPFWTEMPSKEECVITVSSALKFMYARKYKFDINYQAVSDA